MRGLGALAVVLGLMVPGAVRAQERLAPPPWDPLTDYTRPPEALTRQERDDLRELVEAYLGAYRAAGRDHSSFLKTGVTTNVTQAVVSAYKGVRHLQSPLEYMREVGREGPSNPHWGSCIQHQAFTLRALGTVEQESWDYYFENNFAYRHNWVEARNPRTGIVYTFDAWHTQEPDVRRLSQKVYGDYQTLAPDELDDIRLWDADFGVTDFASGEPAAPAGAPETTGGGLLGLD